MVAIHYDMTQPKDSVQNTKWYVFNKLVVFEDGASKNANPYDQINALQELVFNPIFSTPPVDAKPFDGGYVADGLFADIDEIQIIKLGLQKLIELSQFSEMVATNSLIVGPTGKIESLSDRYTDVLLVKAPKTDGTPGENYVGMTIIWKGQDSCINKSEHDSGEKMFGQVKKVSDRLAESNSKVKSVNFSFLSRNRN